MANWKIAAASGARGPDSIAISIKSTRLLPRYNDGTPVNPYTLWNSKKVLQKNFVLKNKENTVQISRVRPQ